MPTADPSNILFKIAHPDLYEHNPFNVLNLPVTATAKDIRRRKEDIEAAFDAGTEAEEFSNILPRDRNRKLPTRDIVSAAFASLDNPEERLAWTLFWFWETPEMALPTDRHGRIVGNANGRISDQLCRRWMEQGLKDEGPESAIALHNAAVEQHMICFDIENRLASGRDVRPTPDFIAGFWKRAILFWNRSVNSDDVWHALVDYATDLNDRRVDYKAARRFRDQFALAFDQINAELAIDYARCGRESDAKRQVEYMKLSQPDSDDVEGTFDNAFSGLLRQTESIVKTASEEIRKAPKRGLEKANEILSRTEEPLRISRIVLEKGMPVRNGICAMVFRGVRECLIAYGNAEKDWDSCLTLAEKLQAIAETPEQTRLVDEDRRVLQQNKTASDENNHCWFCKRILNDHNRADRSVSLYGNLHTYRMPSSGLVSKLDYEKLGKVFFSTQKITIPCCKQCRRVNVSSHPAVAKLLGQGWHIGAAPSQEEINWFAKHGTEWSAGKAFKEETNDLVKELGIKILLGGAGLVFIGLIFGAFYIIDQVFKALFNIDLGMFR